MDTTEPEPDMILTTEAELQQMEELETHLHQMLGKSFTSRFIEYGSDNRILDMFRQMATEGERQGGEKAEETKDIANENIAISITDKIKTKIPLVIGSSLGLCLAGPAGIYLGAGTFGIGMAISGGVMVGGVIGDLWRRRQKI